MTDTRTPRPSVHQPLSKSYAIDQIADPEKLRAVAHRMWEAFSAAHSQAAHIFEVLQGLVSCPPCMAYLSATDKAGPDTACDRYQQWQAKVRDGFGSV